MLTKSQLKFENLVLARWADNASRKKRSKVAQDAARKNIGNIAKISVTKTGSYANSYSASIPAVTERHCRINASSLINLVLADMVGNDEYYTRVFPINGATGTLNKLQTRNIFDILKYNKLTNVECACCKKSAKYAYFERGIDPTAPKNRPFTVSFCCVNVDGTESAMTIDHVIPTSEGGKNHVSNMQILCRMCNGLKSSLPNHMFMHARTILDTVVNGKNNGENKS